MRFPRTILLCLLIGLGLPGCNQSPKPGPAPSGEKAKVESNLARTTLTAKAKTSLRIQTAPVANRLVQDHLELPGWVMIPQGKEVTLTAPVAGYVRSPHNLRNLPLSGLPARANQELFSLEPVLAPLEQVQLAALKRTIDNDLAKAQESVKLAERDLKRILDLKELKLQKEVDEARTRLVHAKEDLGAARFKQKLFGSSKQSASLLPSISIRSKHTKTVLTVHVSPGQYVPAAAPLVTLADLSQLWVRVPIPENDLAQVNAKQATTIHRPIQGRVIRESDDQKAMAGQIFQVKPLALVPQVDSAKHTADLLYELDPFPLIDAAAGKNGNNKKVRAFFAKDQLVTVFVPLGKKSRESVVPYSAVIFDAYAGTWIYLDKTPADGKQQIYERRRVELGPAENGGIVVRPRLASGERVVIRGAAALFSREFHRPPK